LTVSPTPLHAMLHDKLPYSRIDPQDLSSEGAQAMKDASFRYWCASVTDSPNEPVVVEINVAPGYTGGQENKDHGEGNLKSQPSPDGCQENPHPPVDRFEEVVEARQTGKKYRSDDCSCERHPCRARQI
jgi:hypothetical protein